MMRRVLIPEPDRVTGCGRKKRTVTDFITEMLRCHRFVGAAIQYTPSFVGRPSPLGANADSTRTVTEALAVRTLQPASEVVSAFAPRGEGRPTVELYRYSNRRSSHSQVSRSSKRPMKVSPASISYCQRTSRPLSRRTRNKGP